MILAAGYLLFMFQRVVFGELSDFLRARRPPDRHEPGRDPDAGAARRARRRLRAPAGAPARPLPEHGQRDARRGPGRRRPIASRPGRVGVSGSLVLAVSPHRLGRCPATPRRDRSSPKAGPPIELAGLRHDQPARRGHPDGAAIIVVDLVRPGRRRRGGDVADRPGDTAILAIVVGAVGRTAFGGAYKVDALTTFLDLLFIAIIALTIVFAPDYLVPRGLPVAEFATVLVFAMTGAMLIAASADLLVLFLGLELMVLPGYLLAGFHKTDGYSTEGAIKYFLLGSFSSAIFLFGLAFVWGLTGTTRIDVVASELAEIVAGTAPLSPGLAMGLAFLTTGVAFKIAAVPFHYWTPDAYQGSPTPVTGYLSVGPKVGAFALILRLFVEALGPLADWWLPVMIVLAALTMTLGNLVALTQDNVKRMLAYSSIAHTGYMLVGLPLGRRPAGSTASRRCCSTAWPTRS